MDRDIKKAAHSNLRAGHALEIRDTPTGTDASVALGNRLLSRFYDPLDKDCDYGSQVSKLHSRFQICMIKINETNHLSI